MGQLLRLLFVILLPVGAEYLLLVGSGAAVDLLIPLLTLPVIWLLLYLGFGTDTGAVREDLGESLRRGGLAGKLFALCFVVWGILVLTVFGVRATQRISDAIGAPLLILLLLFVLAIWMARGDIPSFARSAEIFYLVILASLLGILLLGLPKVELSYLVFGQSEISSVGQGVLRFWGFLAIALYALFFRGDITRRESDRRAAQRNALFLLSSIMLLLILTLGSFGPALAETMERPLLQMVGALGLGNSFQRLEALVSAIWMLGDLCLLAFMLCALQKLGAVFGAPERSRGTLVVVGAVGFGLAGVLLTRDSLLRVLESAVLPWGGLVVGILLYSILLFQRFKKKSEKENEKKA